MKKMTLNRIFILVILFFSLYSCSFWSLESFEEENKPYFEEIDDEDSKYLDGNLLSSYLLKPWNYEKFYNFAREYPLVIFLHGSGAYPYIPQIVSMLGYHNDEYKSAYPSFVLAPRFTGQWGNDYDELIGKIENIKNSYRIDESRIYIVGYSMGAYWTIEFLNYYREYNGTMAAAFVSEAGLSYRGDPEKLIDKTSIWIHVGDSDSSFSSSMNAYNSLKADSFFENAKETSEPVDIEEYEDSITTTHTVRFVEVLKNTVYKDTGHGVMSLPFKDPAVLEWIFEQDLLKR